MTTRAMSRRSLLETGAFALVAAAVMPEIVGAHAPAGLSANNEQTVRKYYAAWEAKDWHTLDMLLTAGFTFTSPNNDDHISKGVFKTRCWDPNVNLIEHFDLQQVLGNGNDALVMYVLHIKNGKTVENVEHLQMKDGKVESVRCYFGQQNSYPSAVAKAGAVTS